MANPGPVAQLALLLVVPASILAFALLPPVRAVLVIFMGSMLFLPERVNFDPPMIPPLDKQSIPAICMLVGVVVTSRWRMRAARVGTGVDWILFLSFAMIVGTVLTNRDGLRYGPRIIPGYVPSDILSEGIAFALATATPFLLGRVLFRDPEAARDLLRAFVIGGLVYAPLIAIEIRLSPQWHNWIYGFGQHKFGQTVREGGGYRPMCFMAHGLALAMFMWGSALAAWTLAKSNGRLLNQRLKPYAWGLTLLFPFIKSAAATIYLAIAVPLAWFASPRAQLRLCTVIAILIATYPPLRSSDSFPTQTLSNMAAMISAERQESLEFRFKHEDRLVERALERPAFGWGTYGRNRLYNKYGEDASVVDGAWIRTMGVFGIAGLVFQFGLLLVPILLARRRLERVAPEHRPLLSGVTMMAAFFGLDLLPNGMYNGLPALLAGAVAGLAQGLPQSQHAARGDPLAALRLLLQRVALARAQQLGFRESALRNQR